MSRSQLVAVNDLIRSGPDLSALPTDALRIAYDAIGDITPPADDIMFESVRAGGVPAEFGRAPGASADHIILYFHGGGYIIGSLKSHRGLVSILGRAAAARTLAVDYRMAPEAPFPAASDDGIAAYRWLLEEKHCAPGAIAFAGDSAGGGLALATLIRARDEGLPMPAAAVLFSPFADLSCSGDSLQEKAAEDLMVSAEVANGMARTYLAGSDPNHPYVSPVFGDLAGLPPLLIHTSTAEVLLDDSLRVLRNAALANLPVTMRLWPDLPHVFQIFSAILDEGRQSLEEAGQFLAKHLK